MKRRRNKKNNKEIIKIPEVTPEIPKIPEEIPEVEKNEFEFPPQIPEPFSKPDKGENDEIDEDDKKKID